MWVKWGTDLLLMLKPRSFSAGTPCFHIHIRIRRSVKQNCSGFHYLELLMPISVLKQCGACSEMVFISRPYFSEDRRKECVEVCMCWDCTVSNGVLWTIISRLYLWIFHKFKHQNKRERNGLWIQTQVCTQYRNDKLCALHNLHMIPWMRSYGVKKCITWVTSEDGKWHLWEITGPSTV